MEYFNKGGMSLKALKNWCCDKGEEGEGEGGITKAIAIYKDWVVPRMRGISSKQASQKKARKATQGH